MDQVIAKILRTLRAQRRDRAKELLARAGALRERISKKWQGGDSVTIIRSIREGR